MMPVIYLTVAQCVALGTLFHTLNTVLRKAAFGHAKWV